MRILLLGDSGSVGNGLADPNQSWAALLPAKLEPCFGPVRLIDRLFFPGGPGAVAFADRLIMKEGPDVVLCHLSTYPFTVTDVGYAVRDRFGARAQAVFEGVESRFRAVSQRTGSPGVTADAGAKRIARRLIGRAPLLREEVVTATWLGTLDRLAREETVQTFVHAPFIQSAAYQAWYPLARKARDRFTDTIMARATHHHFGWIDVEPAIAAAPGGSESSVHADGVHRNELGHRITADFVAETLIKGLPAQNRPERLRKPRPQA